MEIHCTCTMYKCRNWIFEVACLLVLSHWSYMCFQHVCNQHFTSISCKHQSNLDWFHSVSNEGLIGFGEIEYDTNISLSFKCYIPYPRSASIRVDTLYMCVYMYKCKFASQILVLIFIQPQSCNTWQKKNMCLRSPDQPPFYWRNPNFFYWQFSEITEIPAFSVTGTGIYHIKQ